LEGAIATFPLMYHYRIMQFSGQRLDVNLDRHKEYVESWGNSVNVGNYALDRAIANYELVLFLEYIPHVKQKDTKFPHTELQRLLKETGFLPGAEFDGSSNESRFT
jgi:hypothetical protein